jgi:ferredoxin-type protein NapH
MTVDGSGIDTMSTGGERRGVESALLHWRAERESAALYAGLALLERSPRRRAVYERLAQLEERHAEIWVGRILASGMAVPAFRASLRTRLLLAFARWLGTPTVLPRIARLERAEAAAYDRHGVAGLLLEEERGNASLLTEFSQHETTEFFKKLIIRFRRTVILAVGASLFAVALSLGRNVQLEGLFFGLATGVVVGPVTHYLIGKLLLPLPMGRIWCGWACWTAALLDQLPYRTSAGWLPGRVRSLRTLHLVASLTLVATLVALGYVAGAVGPQAAGWFLAGNLLYWTTGVVLAVRLQDNRAFCKYVCPVSVLLRLTARPALFKIAGEAQACRECTSKACTTLCPMDVDIPTYVERGERVLATECILCQYCVAVCPSNTLAPTFALDLAGGDALQERPRA